MNSFVAIISLIIGLVILAPISIGVGYLILKYLFNYERDIQEGKGKGYFVLCFVIGLVSLAIIGSIIGTDGCMRDIDYGRR